MGNVVEEREASHIVPYLPNLCDPMHMVYWRVVHCRGLCYWVI